LKHQAGSLGLAGKNAVGRGSVAISESPCKLASPESLTYILDIGIQTPRRMKAP
jgi:hypothetical protein